ncbi:MAG: hypothetical protein M1326_07585 [Cyanobacteria bacterium]|nr:hypothetical protein [Cyanobacteriota bacterium]
MSDKIKTALEIAMEKASMIEDLSPEEKESLENRKKMEPIMVSFYSGKTKPEELWNKIRGEKQSLYREIQFNLVDSLKFKLMPEEFQRRKKAILAVETLKKEPEISVIEQDLNQLENLLKMSAEEKKHVFNEFKKAIEKNPQARMKVIEQGEAKIAIKLSIEDAVLQNPQWKQFMMEFEQKYEQEFARITENIKKEIKK